MKTKTVYQCTPDWWFVSALQAEESPLEPGQFLIPAMCVEPAPMEAPAGKRQRFIDKAWQLQDWPIPLVVQSKPEPTQTELLARAKAELRTMRAPMLDALTGIAGRATRAGNDTLAAEADALAELLLDITDDLDLNAATTYESMQATGVLAYKRISATASPQLRIVFREITGV